MYDGRNLVYVIYAGWRLLTYTIGKIARGEVFNRLIPYYEAIIISDPLN